MHTQLKIQPKENNTVHLLSNNYSILLLQMHSAHILIICLLGICHCSIFDECKIVGDVFIIRQPTMGSNNTIQTCCYLRVLEKLMKPRDFFFWYWNLHKKRQSSTFAPIYFDCWHSPRLILTHATYQYLWASLRHKGTRLILGDNSFDNGDTITDSLRERTSF